MAGRLRTLLFQPACWQQRFDLILVGHARQTRQHIFEILARIDAQATAVLHHGVDDRGFFSRVLRSDEQPVLRSQLGGTDGVFDEVVVDLDAAIRQIGLKIPPLVHGVGDGFAQMTFWQDAATFGELVDELFEALVDGTAFGGARRFPQDGAGLGFAQPVLNLIEVGDLPEDPADQARRLVFGFKKFPPHMGVATHERDVTFALGPRGVGAEAIALDDGGRWWMCEA